MKYETIYDDFIGMFPNDSNYFKELEEENGVDKDTVYLLFSMVICPFLHKVVEEDEEKAIKAFDFIEQMESSDDIEIANLADVGILETILTDENGGYSKFGKYLGDNTKKSVQHLSQFFYFQK